MSLTSTKAGPDKLIFKNSKMRVLFPGSFNPFTIGHKNIVDRALRLFDTVVIAVGVNSAKEENATGAAMRAEHIRAIYKENPNVEVISYSTLTANVVKEYNIDCIIRGIRNAADLEYEDEITRVNYTVFGVETLYLLADPQLKEVSSTVARELNKYGVQI